MSEGPRHLRVRFSFFIFCLKKPSHLLFFSQYGFFIPTPANLWWDESSFNPDLPFSASLQALISFSFWKLYVSGGGFPVWEEAEMKDLLVVSCKGVVCVWIIWEIINLKTNQEWEFLSFPLSLSFCVWRDKP